jgi:hypothetical protein
MLHHTFYKLLSIYVKIGNFFGFPLIFDRTRKRLYLSQNLHSKGVLFYLIWSLNTLFIIFKAIHLKYKRSFTQFYFLFPFTYAVSIYNLCQFMSVIQPEDVAQLYNTEILFAEKMQGIIINIFFISIRIFLTFFY